MKEAWTKRCYYDLLFKYKERYSLIFHAYHLMENHLHLVGWLESLKGFSFYFRTVNNLFSRFVNRKLERSGQVIMDRFKSPRIEGDRHLLSVMVYNDLNGVRAGREKTPEDSTWSSYKYYAYGKNDDLIVPAPSYLALADNSQKRQREYRDLIRAMMLLDRHQRSR